MANIRETEVPTDLVAGLLMAAASAPVVQQSQRERLTARIYAVMTVTAALTFATLTVGYQLIFGSQIFA